MQGEEHVTTFKVALLGEVNVGKTSVFHRLKTGRFAGAATATIGTETVEKEYAINGDTIRLQVWDTAGSEKYRTLTSNYYRGAAAILYFYDLSEEDSLFGLVTWVDDARRFQPDHTRFLIGNKCDIEGEDVSLTESTIQSFCQDNGFEMSLSMSAKSGQGVDACFNEVARVLAEQYQRSTYAGNGEPVRIGVSNQDHGKANCCAP